ncbi:hypothetical protein D020_1364A, partial [Vibrio parahaemolyticus SBR10290]
MYWRGFH